MVFAGGLGFFGDGALAGGRGAGVSLGTSWWGWINLLLFFEGFASATTAATGAGVEGTAGRAAADLATGFSGRLTDDVTRVAEGAGGVGFDGRAPAGFPLGLATGRARDERSATRAGLAARRVRVDEGLGCRLLPPRFRFDALTGPPFESMRRELWTASVEVATAAHCRFRQLTTQDPMGSGPPWLPKRQTL
jgi:hypothetical protein